MSEALGPGPGEPGGPGRIETGPEAATLIFRRRLSHPIEEVWSALTDPAQLRIWYLAEVTREDRPGGRLTMDHPNGLHATGRVVTWEPPRTYEYEWDLPDGPLRPGGERTIVRWELSPGAGGSTLLVLTHRRLSPPLARVFVRGLPVLLDRLSAQLAGAPLPEEFWAPRTPAGAAPVDPHSSSGRAPRSGISGAVGGG